MRARFVVAIILGVHVLSLGPLVQSADADMVVLPPEFATVEGDGFFFRPLGTSPQTVQYAYGSSLLAGVPRGSAITGFQYRADHPVRPPESPIVVFANYEVTVSTSTFAPGSLSAIFADNIASDAVLARHGALTFAADDVPTGGAPNAFGPLIDFTTPFIYHGGDLLLTIRHTGGGIGNTVVVDVQGDDNRLQSVFTDEADATEGFALAGSAPIIRVAYDVPEPATLLLLSAGLLSVAAAAGSRSTAPVMTADDAVQAARQWFDAFANGFGRHDAGAVAALYAPDADQQISAGGFLRGRAEIEAYLARAFARNPTIRQTMQLTSARLVDESLIIADGVWEMTGLTDGRPAKGSATYVLRRSGTGWLCIAGRSMVPAPAVPAPAGGAIR